MNDSTPHCVLADHFDDASVARLGAVGRVTVVDGADTRGLSCALADADALLVRTRTPVTRELMAAAPKLRVIGRGGVGLDNIDLTGATERGITVVHTPDAGTESVADLTVGLMLALVRDLPGADQAARADRYVSFRNKQRVRELHELTIGIVGMGRIGRAVARRCRAGFGCRVIYHDIVDVGWLDVRAEAVSKETLFRTSDVVTLHVPLTPLTRDMVNAEALSWCRPECLLINTSRGAVVDSRALAQALFAHRLGGAGLDVLDVEPPPADHPILAAPRCILTPHVGARSILGLDRMNAVVDDVIRVLRGARPLHAYQPEAT